MRTTVNIDDDVLLAARDRARRERRSLGEVLSDLARRSLASESAPATSKDLHGFRPLPSRGGRVTNELIDQLREDGPE